MLSRMLQIPIKGVHFGLQIPRWLMKLPSLIIKSIVGDQGAVIDDLFDEAEQNQNRFASRKVGCVGNHVAVYMPTTTAELKKILKQLDEDKNSRSGFVPLAKCVGDNFFSISGDRADLHRKLAILPLLARPQEFAELAIETTKHILDHDTMSPLRDKIELIIRTILFCGLFKLAEFPRELNELITDIQKYAFLESGTLTPFLLHFNSDFGRTKDRFTHFSNQFVASFTDLLANSFKTYPELKESNYVLTTVVNEIVRDNPRLEKDTEKRTAHLQTMPTVEIKKYLQRAFVKSVPAILIAADNLINAVVNVLQQALLEDEEIDDADALMDCWIGSLQTLSPRLMRYSTNGVKIEHLGHEPIVIPPKTMLTITLPASTSEEKSTTYRPTTDAAFFSAGKRMCPGAMPAQVIFTKVIQTIATRYEFCSSDKGVKFVNKVSP